MERRLLSVIFPQLQTEKSVMNKTNSSLQFPQADIIRGGGGLWQRVGWAGSTMIVVKGPEWGGGICTFSCIILQNELQVCQTSDGVCQTCFAKNVHSDREKKGRERGEGARQKIMCLAGNL
jgi:hypothetical protein